MALDNTYLDGGVKTPGWRFWIDRGGTFTDIVAISPDGAVGLRKLLSEAPRQYHDAAIEGIRQILALPPDSAVPASVAEVKMGTTVATNALLERRGAPVVWITTRGFADALRIGYQNRPALFALQIQRPEPLYMEVIEADERLSADGQVLRALDLDALRPALQAALARGCRSCAIALLHAYRNGEHERRIGVLARALGFTEVSVSHETSPLIRFVARAETTVADAYLTPVLGRYVSRLADGLGHRPLLFMQSSGGLAPPGRFRGKDAVLSGPAGGVVGVAESARSAGIEEVIGFDMGGTSTDVSHYAGTYERVAQAEIAGVQLRTPMLQVHTVAAGGGSILSFDGERFRVGPASAGANPGPACYGRGGPLTVTDANLLLGRLDPRFFPRAFGADGRQPLDRARVVSLFDALAEDVGRRLGRPMFPQAIARGFLQIANETVALAVKRISLQRGRDLSRYTLCAFGGAGGQHATSLAEALEMPQVLLHPFAGVLSAFGIGLADRRALRETAVESALDAALVERLRAQGLQLAHELTQEMRAQGVDPAHIGCSACIRLRTAGTDTALEVPFELAQPAEVALRARFDAAHRQRYGFAAPARAPVVVESLAVEAVGRTPRPCLPAPRAARATPLEPIATTPLFVDDAWQDVPVYERSELCLQDRVEGPALIVEATGTIVVDRGWQAGLDAAGNLLLRRSAAAQAARGAGAEPDLRADPTRLELFGRLFMAIAEQMGTTLEQTSHSVNIKERLDFSCAVFDGAGRLIANAPHMPVHLGSMGESVRAVLSRHRERLAPGQAYVLNAPYNGGTHLPDVTVVTPVFVGDGVAPDFWLASRGHHADIGGSTPGSMPPHSTSIEEEGVLLDALLLVDDGELREAELRERLCAGPYPVRNIEQNLADLRAQLAANRSGDHELRRAVERHGLATLRAYMGHLLDQAEQAVRRTLGRLRSGSFRYAMDDGAVIAVDVQIDAQAGRAVVDFAGTSAQRPNNFNAPASVCRAAVLYVFRTLIDEDIPLNEGCLRPIDLRIPQGSMLNPRYPAAVVAGNVETSQCVVDALYGALGVMAAAQGTMNNVSFGNERYQYYETLCGGAGAGPGWHGASAVHTHMTNSRLTDPEVLESRFPVRLEVFEIRRGSGGDGRWRGGDGVRRRLRFLQPVTAGVIANRRRIPPFGLAAGRPGACGEDRILRADGRVEPVAPGRALQLGVGDALEVATPGGGGYGDPQEGAAQAK